MPFEVKGGRSNATLTSDTAGFLPVLAEVVCFPYIVQLIWQQFIPPYQIFNSPVAAPSDGYINDSTGRCSV